MADKNDGERMLLLSGGFTQWLAEMDTSVVFTTYQAGRAFFIGRKQTGDVWAHERAIRQCQGLWTDGQTLWTSSLHTLWRFENSLLPQHLTDKGSDRLFVPREGRVTGRIDMHDIGMSDWDDGIRRPLFVNTAFNCLATISETKSFREVWRPPFISALVAEDRCHLNGLAMDDGKATFVTAISKSDVADGWRDRRRDGGVVIDVASSEIVAQGLSMPHSPRMHDGKLWLLNSGTGEFGQIDPKSGKFTPVCFCPGYARGLAFIGGYAVLGLSRPRNNVTFEGLALEDALKTKDAEPRCGLLVIDLKSGSPIHWLRLEHTIDELYDVAVLPGVRQAEAIGFVSDEIERTITPEAV